MSKRTKKWTSVLLAVAMVFGAMLFSMEAKAYSPNALRGGGAVTIQSTQPYTGPLPGAVQKGDPVRCSTHQNISNLSDAYSFIAYITGAPASSLVGLAAKIVQYNTKNQYYTRTWYYDEMNAEGYHKYDYYADENYTIYLGTAYSYVYSYLF